FFVDIVDRIDAIIDTTGTCVSYDILGDITCKSRLSGMPHLVMTLNRARELDDVAFHPCVVRRTWDAERMIAFVPPDGPFKLASYHMATQALSRSMPLRVLGEARCTENGMTVCVTVEPGETGSRSVENIRIRVPLDSRAYNIGVQCKSGTHMVTTSRRPQVEWTLDEIRPSDSAIRLVIQYSTRNAVQSDSTNAAFVTFEVPGYSVSSIKVDALRLLRESYKLFKGVRYSTVAGSFQLSCVLVLATTVCALDFHSDEAAECATKHWSEIRDIVNPKISMMDKILPKAGVERVRKLLDGKDELPKDPPPRSWLGEAADAIPEGLMSMFGKKIIEECVDEMKHK
ncbi:hypothetical protein GGH14_004723, partial [Coemansia sp. RSA 370]